MSEVAKPVEATPAPATTAAADPAPLTSPASATPATEATPATDTITPAGETVAAAAKEDAAAKTEIVPATDGTLGYKGPGILHSIRFSKRFFWFSDESLKTDTLDSYLRAEKAEIAHPNAAWAHESGKGLLFFAKRAEDKAAPTGILNLADISDIIKETFNEFSFKVNGHKHVFQAGSKSESAAWIAAIETKATEAKAMKDGVISSDGYKSHVERYAKLGVGAATTGSAFTGFSKSKERKETSAPRKSLDTKAKETAEKAKADASSGSSSDAERKDKKEKSRSQSRKRGLFGLLGNKKEEQDEKKVEKEVAKEQNELEKDAAKEEKKHEKEVAKEEKKVEKEEKQAEAKATHQPSDIAEAGVATVVAAAPGAIGASHDKTDETKPEQSTTRTVENHEKKAGKRASIFGSFFSGKKDATSPTVEKNEAETAPAVPAKGNDVTAVSEKAPKIDEPAQSKPIDTAAVIAPADSAIPAPDAAASSAHAQTTVAPTAAKSPSTPSHKGGIVGFFKRQDSGKAEPKTDTKPEETVTSPTSTEVAPAAETPAAEAPAAEAPASPPTEEKPSLITKRRTSLFTSLVGKKDKKSGEATTETEAKEGENKISQLPQKIGGMLFRKPSKAVKSGAAHGEAAPTATQSSPATGAADGVTSSPTKDEAVLTNGTSDAAKEPTGPVAALTTDATTEIKAAA